MMVWLEDLQTALIATNLVPLGNVVIGPPNDDDTVPDLCLGLVDRPGPTDVTYGATYVRPNLTLVMRSEPFKPADAYLLLDQVYAWLTAQANVTFGESSFLWFEPMMSPGRLGLDSKFRTDLTAEIGVWRDELEVPSLAGDV